MTRPEWGKKRQCPKCGTRFYDLTKDDPVVCIECGHSWIPEVILKSKQALPFDDGKEKSADTAEEELDADDLDLDDADGDPSEDAQVDLGSDSEDISEVVVDKRKEDDD